MNRPSFILVLGEPLLASQISNWIAGTARNGESIGLAVREDHAPLTLPDLHSDVDYLGPVSRPASEALAADHAGPDSFLITCYWPWILPESTYAAYSGATLNFHPALLPRDRGWYPHVHQIRHNLQGGVTLHQLEADADTGRVWAQREVTLPFPITAGEARELLREGIFNLFTDTWWGIANGEIQPWSQQGPATYHSKDDVLSLDHIDRNSQMSFEDAIRAIACRNSGHRSFLRIDGDDGPSYIHINFTTDGRLRTK